MTEMFGYNGPISRNFFTSAMIKNLYKALPAGEEGGREINTKPCLYDRHSCQTMLSRPTGPPPQFTHLSETFHQQYFIL